MNFSRFFFSISVVTVTLTESRVSFFKRDCNELIVLDNDLLIELLFVPFFILFNA